jgi:hypothetical protein
MEMKEMRLKNGIDFPFRGNYLPLKEIFLLFVDKNILSSPYYWINQIQQTMKSQLIVFRVALIVLIISGIVSLITLFFGSPFITLNVRPAFENSLIDSVILKDYKHTIKTAGILYFNNPSLTERILLPSRSFFHDFITNILVLFISIQILLGFKEFNDNALFRNKITIYLKRIGIAILVFSLINFAREGYITNKISDITNKSFVLNERVSTDFEVWTGILILLLATVLKKGSLLQKEQDLTI